MIALSHSIIQPELYTTKYLIKMALKVVKEFKKEKVSNISNE